MIVQRASLYLVPIFLTDNILQPKAGDMGLVPGLGRSPWGGHGDHFSTLAWTHGQRSPAGYSPQGCTESDRTEATKQQQQHLQGLQTVKNLPTIEETKVLSLGEEDPLEKGMATQCGLLDWEIPWTK